MNIRQDMLSSFLLFFSAVSHIHILFSPFLCYSSSLMGSWRVEMDEEESQRCISCMMLPLSDEHIQVSRYTLLNAGTNFLLNYAHACSVLMPPTLLTNLSISWTQEKALAKKDSSYLMTLPLVSYQRAEKLVVMKNQLLLTHVTPIIFVGPTTSLLNFILV